MRTWVPRSLPAGSAAGHPHRLLVSRLGTRTPAERRENAARYLALQVVGLLYHADVRVGAQADFAHNGEVGAAFQALRRGSRLGLVGPRVLQGNISTRHTCRTTAAWARGMGPAKSQECVIFCTPSGWLRVMEGNSVWRCGELSEAHAGERHGIRSIRTNLWRAHAQYSTPMGVQSGALASLTRNGRKRRP